MNLFFNKITYLFFLFTFLFFSLTPKTEAAFYFFEILQNLAGDRSQSVKIEVENKLNEKKVEIKKDGQPVGKVELNTKTGEIKLNSGIKEVKANISKPETYLEKIISGLGINPIQVKTLSTQQNQNNLQQQTNPFLNTPIISNTPLGNIISNPDFAGQLFGNQGFGGFMQNVMSGNPQAAVNGLNSSPMFQGLVQQSTPYKGPGGATASECGIPKGPVAYNIGGTNGDGVSCKAQTVFVDFYKESEANKSKCPSGKFCGGYVNPMVEEDESKTGAETSFCKGNAAQKYDEKCFEDYSQGDGLTYVQGQLLRWQKEAERIGQSCIPVDIDNCDAIGQKNYQAILDMVEKLNNKATTKIKVLNKNPHISGCNFMSHPAVVGAFVELDDDEKSGPEIVQEVARLRNNPNQILVFARGGDGTDANLRKAFEENITNASFSFDRTGKKDKEGNKFDEYEEIYNCTYK